MSCPKRRLDEQDPDYEDNRPNDTKRLRLMEENAKADFSHKVSAIIQRQFSEEIAKKEKEAMEIQERLGAVQKTLHQLRYVVISSFYNRKPTQTQNTEQQQKRIHPAVKKLIGKQPRFLTDPLGPRPSRFRATTSHAIGAADTTLAERSGEIADGRSCNTSPERGLPEASEGCSSDGAGVKRGKTVADTVTKIPRYIPPKKSVTERNAVNSFRGNRHKIKKRLVIGNISKWVPVDTREDAASHKWMMYVRGPKESPDVSGFVAKVRFFLHPSYRPHDVVEITSSPFHLSRRGWGEFPVRVQVHFNHPLNKPVDVIHHLKLDRTYTGLQTLGAETVVDIWLHTTPSASAADSSEDKALVFGTEPSEETRHGEGRARTQPQHQEHQNFNTDNGSSSLTSIKKEITWPQGLDISLKRLDEDADVNLVDTPDQILARLSPRDCIYQTYDVEKSGQNSVKHEDLLSCSSSMVWGDVKGDNEIRTTNVKSSLTVDSTTEPTNESNGSEDLNFPVFNSTNHVSNILLSAEQKKSENKSLDKGGTTAGPLSFDHDYFSSCITKEMPNVTVAAEPAQEVKIESEITTPSDVECSLVENDFISDIGEYVVSSGKESLELPPAFLESSDCAIRIKEPREINGLSAQHGVFVNRISVPQSDFPSCNETKAETITPNSVISVIHPEKNVIVETIKKQLDEQGETTVNPCVKNAVLSVKGNTEGKNQVGDIAANKETSKSSIKPLVANTLLSKPTTLVKCMDKSGNVFYITLGGATVKSPLKTTTGLKMEDQTTTKGTGGGSSSVGNIVFGVTKTVSAETKPNSPVSLLTTSLLAKGTQPQRSGNHFMKGKLCNITNPVTAAAGSKPSMKSLINPKTLLLTQSSQLPSKSPISKPAVNNVNPLAATLKQSQVPQSIGNSVIKNCSPGVASDILKKLQIIPGQGLKLNSKTASTSPAGIVDCAAQVDGPKSVPNMKVEQARMSLLLKTNLNPRVTLPGVKVATPSDASKKIQQTSPVKGVKGSSILTPPAQGQTLLLVKNGQFFLLKQPTTTLNTIATKVADKTSLQTSVPSPARVNRDETPSSSLGIAAQSVNQCHRPSSTPPNVSTVLNSLLLQSQSNSGAAVVKVNQPLGITRTYLNASKPGLSLLKKNVNVLAQPQTLLVPPIKMEVTEDSIKKELDEKMAEDDRLLFSGRTLVLNKANSRMVVHPRKPKFEDALKAAVAACKFDSVELAVRWLLKHLPLVSPLAAEPAFRIVHPYAAPSEAVFFQWNFGKRKAAEVCAGIMPMS